MNLKSACKIILVLFELLVLLDSILLMWLHPQILAKKNGDFAPNPNTRLQKYLEKAKSYNYIFLQSKRQRQAYLKIPHCTRTQSSDFLFTTFPFGPTSVFKITYAPVLYICTGNSVHLPNMLKQSTQQPYRIISNQSQWYQNLTLYQRGDMIG